MERRRALVWLLAIPLMFAGSQVAHAVAYRIAYPEAQLRMHELLATGHGYMAWLPRVLGVAFAIEAIALLNLAVDGARGRRARPVPAWMFVALPALGFTIQEFFERALTTDTFPWWMVEQPTFRIGLVLQLPVGLAVYAVARLLLRAARAIGVAWARGRRLRLARVVAPRSRRSVFVARRLGVRVCGWGLRGPPVLSG